MRQAPKKRLGQNFLRDGNARRRIISACGFSRDDVVLEIGPGLGAMTPLIAERVGRVYAVELDRGLAEGLREKFRDSPDVRILTGDILDFDIPAMIPESRSRRIKVFGNIPYYITSPIIERVLGFREFVDILLLTVQKEFARRICAGPGSREYGSFSCYVQYYTRPEIMLDIKRNSFYPVPKVDSSFIRLAVRDRPAVSVPDEEKFFEVIRAAFQQRRKTIRNSLRGIVPGEAMERLYSCRRIDPGVRPERLRLSDFAVLVDPSSC